MVPGENDAYLLANRLDNLVTLCSACHHRAEQRWLEHTHGCCLCVALLIHWVLCDPAIVAHVEQAPEQACLVVHLIVRGVRHCGSLPAHLCAAGCCAGAYFGVGRLPLVLGYLSARQDAAGNMTLGPVDDGSV